MRISDWSSDVCSSDLRSHRLGAEVGLRCARGAILREFFDATVNACAHWHLLRPLRTISVCPLPDTGPINPLPGACTETATRRGLLVRSEELRVGKDCVSQCISRSSPSH